MFAGVLLLVLELCGKVDSVEEWLHQYVMAAWCQRHSAGVGYSQGEYFSCREENSGTLTNESSLKGVTIRIGMIEGGDFGYDCSAVPDTKGKFKAKDSYSLYLLTLLQDVLHFEIKVLGSPSWGYVEESNHTWRGLAGFLVSNVTDMVACHWTATQPVSRIADYLVPTLETTESFVYLPQNLPLTEDVFVAAFSRRLWLFFLLSIFLLVLSFWFSTYMHSRVRPDHEPWSWNEVVLWAVAAISQQSYSRHPRGSSCRTMFLIGYLITYLFYTGFAAGITSLLAHQNRQNQLTFKTVVDMRLNLVVHQDEYFLDLFGEFNSHLEDFNIKWEEGESLKQIFHEIKQTNFLGFGSTVTFLRYLRKKIVQEERGDYLIVPVPHSNRRKAFLVQKSFPYKGLFNYWLLRLTENGLLDLGKTRYLKAEEVAYFQATKWFSAGLGNVFSAVAFLFSGWILSVVVLFVEILWKK